MEKKRASRVSTSKLHFQQEPAIACASRTVSPLIEHGQLETNPAQISSQVLDVFLVGGAIQTDDQLGAVKVVAAGKFEQGHESDCVYRQQTTARMRIGNGRSLTRS